MRILVVTPNFPYPTNGACEQDRARGIDIFLNLGHEVRVITKVRNEEHAEIANKVSSDLGIHISSIKYRNMSSADLTIEKVIWYIKRILLPWHWDGASAEYWDTEIQNKMRDEINSFKPQVVYFDYTYLWPLYFQVKSKKIKIITRSHNFEPRHFLEEDGKTFLNFLKYITKLVSELIVARMSDVVFSINPQEEKIYKRLGSKKVVNLPLRGLGYLPDIFYKIRTKPLHVYFMGSTYNVSHNREALMFLLNEVIPKVTSKMPGEFIFHITGAKFPTDIGFEETSYLKYEGFVVDKQSFLNKMDIAIVPSLFGAGMQQKIFEPLYLGIPTITHKRGLGGYPFLDKEDLLIADSGEEFVHSLSVLKDKNLREKFSTNGKNKSREMFSRKKIESVIIKAIEQ